MGVPTGQIGPDENSVPKVMKADPLHGSGACSLRCEVLPGSNVHHEAACSLLSLFTDDLEAMLCWLDCITPMVDSCRPTFLIQVHSVQLKLSWNHLN